MATVNGPVSNLSKTQESSQIFFAKPSTICYSQNSQSSIDPSSATQSQGCFSSLWEKIAGVLSSIWQWLKNCCGTQTSAQPHSSTNASQPQVQQQPATPTAQTQEEYQAQLAGLAVDREERAIVARLNGLKDSLQLSAKTFKEEMGKIDVSRYKGGPIPSVQLATTAAAKEKQISEQITRVVSLTDPARIEKLRALAIESEQAMNDLKAAWQKIPEETRAGLSQMPAHQSPLANTSIASVAPPVSVAPPSGQAVAVENSPVSSSDQRCEELAQMAYAIFAQTQSLTIHLNRGQGLDFHNHSDLPATPLMIDKALRDHLVNYSWSYKTRNEKYFFSDLNGKAHYIDQNVVDRFSAIAKSHFPNVKFKPCDLVLVDKETNVELMPVRAYATTDSVQITVQPKRLEVTLT